MRRVDFKVGWIRARIPMTDSPESNMAKLDTMLSKISDRKRSTWIIDACVEKMQRDSLKQPEPTMADVMKMLESISERLSSGIAIVTGSSSSIPPGESRKVKANMNRMLSED